MNSNLIEYIKQKYPYIITNGDFFYIIENDKIISFYNGKDIIKLSDKKHISLPKNKKITSIPILQSNYSNPFIILSKKKENKLIKDIKKQLKNKESYNYDAFYNKDKNTFIYLKKEYQKYINDIVKNMHDDQLLIEICKKEIIYNIDIILKAIENYKNNVSNFFLHLNDPNMKITKMFYQQNKKHCNFLLKNLEFLEKEQQEPSYSEKDIFTESTGTFNETVVRRQGTLKPNLLLDNISILKDEIQTLKKIYDKDNLYILLQNSHKRQCKKYILNNKNDIIHSIKDYYNKWMEWCNSGNLLNKTQMHYCKKEIIKNTNALQNTLKDLISSESNKINKNILYIDSILKHLLNNQLIYLSLKENKYDIDNKNTFESIDTVNETNFFDDSEKNIKYRLKKISELLYLNNNTSITTETNNKSEQIFHFIALNNIFFRKQRVISELDDIIQNENLIIHDYILDNFYKIKNDLFKHISFLNLQEIINNPFLHYHKTNSPTSKNIPESFYNNVANVLDFWKFNLLYYRNQDLDILNIINDLIEDITIYVRIKPLVGINDKTLLISTKSTENNITLNGKTYNGFENVFPDDFTNLDVYIGKQDFENNYSSHNVNFLEKYDTVPNGLYNAFNKLQNNYSLFLYGKGISGSGTTFTFFGENGTSGIIQYGLENLKNVSNIRLKYLFEQYVSNVNDKCIKGSIHNLINIVPELNQYFSIDETTQFSEIIPSYIDTRSLNIKDLQDLSGIIDTYRTKMERIKELPSGKSSRSSLYYIFEISNGNGNTKSYLTVVDSSSQDSPNDIYTSFIKDMKLENLTICNKEEAINFIKQHAKNNVRENYSPEFIYKCIQESIYNNEALNHFNYYINSKNNYYEHVTYHNFDEKNYNQSMYFVNPKSEFNAINRNNNCLTIPIMKFIEKVSLKKDIHRIKYHLFYNIRKELSCLPQTIRTLNITQNINDKKLYGSFKKIENHSNYSDYSNYSNYSNKENSEKASGNVSDKNTFKKDVESITITKGSVTPVTPDKGTIKIIIQKEI